MSRVLLGIAWFTPEQWPEVQRTMVDKQNESFVQWIAHAEELERNVKKEGFDVVRVPIDIGDFGIWCARHGRQKDASARSAYVVEQIKKR